MLLYTTSNTDFRRTVQYSTIQYTGTAVSVRGYSVLAAPLQPPAAHHHFSSPLKSKNKNCCFYRSCSTDEWPRLASSRPPMEIARVMLLVVEKQNECLIEPVHEAMKPAGLPRPSPWLSHLLRRSGMVRGRRSKSVSDLRGAAKPSFLPNGPNSSNFAPLPFLSFTFPSFPLSLFPLLLRHAAGKANSEIYRTLLDLPQLEGPTTCINPIHAAQKILSKVGSKACTP